MDLSQQLQLTHQQHVQLHVVQHGPIGDLGDLVTTHVAHAAYKLDQEHARPLAHAQEIRHKPKIVISHLVHIPDYLVVIV